MTSDLCLCHHAVCVLVSVCELRCGDQLELVRQHSQRLHLLSEQSTHFMLLRSEISASGTCVSPHLITGV